MISGILHLLTFRDSCVVVFNSGVRGFPPIFRTPNTPLCRPSVGQRGEVSTTPIERVANRGSLVELLIGDSSGRPCPVR
jgi:hypothetical protein